MTIPTEQRVGDAEQIHRMMFALGIASTWTALPGYIVSFDPAKVTAAVQIGIQGQRLKPDGSTEFLRMPVLADVPVVFPRGGGATLTFPVKPDDECLVVFACRSIDAWWQNGGIQAPSDSRTHDLSDGFCFVGPMTQKNKISNIDPDKVQLRADDGMTFVELDPSGQTVRVVAPNGTRFTGPVHFDDAVTGGNSATFDGDVVGDGVSLHDHVHGGVQSGSDDSGPPL